MPVPESKRFPVLCFSFSQRSSFDVCVDLFSVYSCSRAKTKTFPVVSLEKLVQEVLASLRTDRAVDLSADLVMQNEFSKCRSSSEVANTIFNLVNMAIDSDVSIVLSTRTIMQLVRCTAYMGIFNSSSRPLWYYLSRFWFLTPHDDRDGVFHSEFFLRSALAIVSESWRRPQVPSRALFNSLNFEAWPAAEPEFKRRFLPELFQIASQHLLGHGRDLRTCQLVSFAGFVGVHLSSLGENKVCFKDFAPFLRELLDRGVHVLEMISAGVFFSTFEVDPHDFQSVSLLWTWLGPCWEDLSFVERSSLANYLLGSVFLTGLHLVPGVCPASLLSSIPVEAAQQMVSRLSPGTEIWTTFLDFMVESFGAEPFSGPGEDPQVLVFLQGLCFCMEHFEGAGDIFLAKVCEFLVLDYSLGNDEGSALPNSRRDLLLLLLLPRIYGSHLQHLDPAVVSSAAALFSVQRVVSARVWNSLSPKVAWYNKIHTLLFKPPADLSPHFSAPLTEDVATAVLSGPIVLELERLTLRNVFQPLVDPDQPLTKLPEQFPCPLGSSPETEELLMGIFRDSLSHKFRGSSRLVAQLPARLMICLAYAITAFRNHRVVQVIRFVAQVVMDSTGSISCLNTEWHQFLPDAPCIEEVCQQLIDVFIISSDRLSMGSGGDVWGFCKAFCFSWSSMSDNFLGNLFSASPDVHNLFRTVFSDLIGVLYSPEQPADFMGDTTLDLIAASKTGLPFTISSEDQVDALARLFQAGVISYECFHGVFRITHLEDPKGSLKIQDKSSSRTTPRALMYLFTAVNRACAVTKNSAASLDLKDVVHGIFSRGNDRSLPDLVKYLEEQVKNFQISSLRFRNPLAMANVNSLLSAAVKVLRGDSDVGNVFGNTFAMLFYLLNHRVPSNCTVQVLGTVQEQEFFHEGDWTEIAANTLKSAEYIWNMSCDLGIFPYDLGLCKDAPLHTLKLQNPSFSIIHSMCSGSYSELSKSQQKAARHAWYALLFGRRPNALSEKSVEAVTDQSLFWGKISVFLISKDNSLWFAKLLLAAADPFQKMVTSIF